VTWSLGLDDARGPGEDEDVASDRAFGGESVYYGPSPNGTRREYGIPPANGRNMPSTYPVQTGIGGRTVTQPVMNGVTLPPWHRPLNGTKSSLGVAQPNGFSRPFGLSPQQFEEGKA
jgi:hypothetical protein